MIVWSWNGFTILGQFTTYKGITLKKGVTDLIAESIFPVETLD